MVNIGIVGTGFIGKVHAEGYRNIPNAKLSAVVDTDRVRGEKFAGDYGARHYPTLDSMLADGKVDAMDICAPTYLHAGMTEAAAAAGKHILCEKPMALSLTDADRMIKAAEKAGVKAMVGHTMRFWPEYVKAREIILGGELGRPLNAFCERLAAVPDWHKDSWGFDVKKSGGASVDLQIHDLDYLIWVFGDPASVHALGVYDDGLGGLYHINSCITFKSGVSATVIAGWGFTSSFPFTMSLRVFCEKGTVEWLFRAGRNIEERGRKSKLTVYKKDGSLYEPETGIGDAYHLECAYFVDCIENSRGVELGSFRDAKRSLDLALKSTESAVKGETIRI